MTAQTPATADPAPAVELHRVSKTFQSFQAVREVSLNIRPGEFFSLLGPSGCGKTTTLRLIAGFEQPDSDGGKVRIQGAVVNGRRPYDRPLGMVFQSYALFPHLTVEENIAFGLQQRATPRHEIGPRVAEAMAMVQLDQGTFGRRMPAALSGGQRQRVALARALVVRPPILLLDEPLGALDLKLRKEMQFELKQLNRKLGITFIYVTHDQEEALTMSDRIAVMAQARVAQLGTPAEIYERPRTAFVARFIGETNQLDGVVLETGAAHTTLRHASGAVFQVPARAEHTPGSTVMIALRPERLALRLDAARAEENALPATVEALVYRGEMLHVRLALAGGGRLLAAARNEGQLRNPYAYQPGAQVHAVWAVQDAAVLEAE